MTKFTFAALVLLILPLAVGCDSVGSDLAKWLPEKDGPSIGNGQLTPSGDSSSIDPNQIGGGNHSSMAQPAAQESGNGRNGAMQGFVDPAMGGDYAGMMEEVDAQVGPNGDAQEGAFMGVGEYQQSIALEDPANGIEQGDLTADYAAQMGEFSFPTLGDSDGLGDDYAASMGLTDPAMGLSGNDDPTAGYLAANGIGGNPSGSLEKPKDTRAPAKRPSARPGGKPNIRDLPPKNQRDQTAPKRPVPPPANVAPSGKDNSPSVQIGIPPQVSEPAFDVASAVAVPILLQKGTSMSFGAELLPLRSLPAKGTVFWMVHSKQLGFNRFAVPVTGGRVNGVVPKFTPTSGPFRTFVVLVESTGKVHYLSRAVDIAWNP